MIILHNATIYSDDRVYDNHSILIENQKIIALLPSCDVKLDGAEVIDCTGKILTPGFIDLQINGFGGKLLNSDINRECFEVMTKSARKYGATTIAPTLITTSDENIEKALNLAKELQEEFRYDISGLHIEGPYLNMEKRGVHNPKYVRKPEMAMIEKIAESAEVVSIVTLAPENATREHIQTLTQAGIVVSLGHTNSCYSQAITGIENGISMATHLYNAMSGYAGRTPGALGAVFNSDIYAGIIADGFHCDYASIEIAKKIKGDKLFLVTDAASPAGTDMKEFVFEGIPAIHENGKLFTKEGTLAGSALTMIDAVKNCVKYTTISFKEAVKMATVYPAKAIHIDHFLGKIQPEYIANILILNQDLSIDTVIHKGSIEKLI